MTREATTVSVRSSIACPGSISVGSGTAAGSGGDGGALGDQRGAGLGVEEAELVHRQDQRQDVAWLDPVLGADDRDDVLVRGGDVEQLFVAEVLHDVGLALERRRVVAAFTDVEMLPPEAGDDLSNALGGNRFGQPSRQRYDPAPRADERRIGATALERYIDEVHRRAADEAGDEAVGR